MYLKVALGAWQWKAQQPHPKWENMSKARLWTLPRPLVGKRKATMDFGRIRARLASPLTEVKSSESGKINVVNIEVTGRMVKMLCGPHEDPQDALKFLEPTQTDLMILNGDLASGADHLSPVVLQSSRRIRRWCWQSMGK